MESKNKLLNYYMSVQGIESHEVARAEFMQGYVLRHGACVDPLIDDIAEKTSKDGNPNSLRNATLTAAHLVTDAIDFTPSMPWLEMLNNLSTIANGAKHDVLMSPALSYIASKKEELTAQGLSILTIVPATSEAILLFRNLFSSQQELVTQMITFNLPHHFQAFVQMVADEMSPQAKGYKRFPRYLQDLIKQNLYEQSLSIDHSAIRAMFFGLATLSNEELYHRSIINMIRNWKPGASSLPFVDMPPLTPDFVNKYGNMIARDVFDNAHKNLRYGMTAQMAERFKRAIDHLSDQGLDWLEAFAFSELAGCNPATANDDLGEVDREQALHEMLKSLHFRESKVHESSRIFCNLIMDTLPKQLVITALDTDKMLKRRYDHTGDPFFLGKMKESASLEEALQEDLGL